MLLALDIANLGVKLNKTGLKVQTELIVAS